MFNNILDLSVAFFRANILSYGGGPASIPLMRSEIVDKYKWFSTEEFADALAISNTLPGPIAPKMAAYVGYNVAGIWGAVCSVLAAVLPTAIIMVVLANILLRFTDHPGLKGMLKVAKPIVAVLLLQAAIELMTKTNYYSYVPVVISLITAVLVLWMKINPAIVIMCGLVLGFAFNKYI